MRPIDIPSVQYRGENLVNILIRNRPDVASYELRAASRLADAYGAGFGVGGGGTLPLMSVRAGRTFFSGAIRSRGLTSLDETTRGRTRIVYDPDEFSVPTPTFGAGSGVSDDRNVNYLRLTPTLKSTGAPSTEGPIYLLPPYDFFSAPVPTYTVTSVAPQFTISPNDIVTMNSLAAMHLVFPSVAQTVYLKNNHTAESLYITFSLGQPPLTLPFGQELTLTGVSVSEIILYSDRANVPWAGSFSFFNFL